MNEDMKIGAIIALQEIKEEIDTITEELTRKGFSVLKGHIEDRINDFRRGM